MTDATKQLRKLLEERGIEWEPPEEIWNEDCVTYWQYNGLKWVAFDTEGGGLFINCSSVSDMTPEQAIEATLGRGTCHNVADKMLVEDCGAWECSECGYDCYELVRPRFCPDCGRRVVS